VNGYCACQKQARCFEASSILLFLNFATLNVIADHAPSLRTIKKLWTF
jgi:hypothetical protein